ncbi:hypothetical protein WA026_010439 [Henosepilachna vigintioctopunctata]|uniref:Uncharacterized protein n=1 Tax=Henosepilachna vigintioctopunctata TaxID=420089 RepID=A0AAW1V516_9CUCU
MCSDEKGPRLASGFAVGRASVLSCQPGDECAVLVTALTAYVTVIYIGSTATSTTRIGTADFPGDALQLPTCPNKYQLSAFKYYPCLGCTTLPVKSRFPFKSLDYVAPNSDPEGRQCLRIHY